MTKFIFVRHGESEANVVFKLGEPSTKLTVKGIEQAHEVGRELKDKDVKYILCSTFVRARQTAEIIATEIGMSTNQIKFSEDLVERRMGALEGTLKNHESEWYHMADEPIMEPRSDVLKRCIKVLVEIKELSKSGIVVVVGHAAAGYYLIEAAKGVRDVKDMSPAKQIPNAKFLEVEIA